MILTADLHLTDAPDEEYRWSIFDKIAKFGSQQKDLIVCILGDLTDRKDRHSAKLVNKVVGRLAGLVDSGFIFHIIMGNHDRLLNGDAFWSFLNELHNVNYYVNPVVEENCFFLPYTTNLNDWHGLFEKVKKPVCFIHQPVTGARMTNGSLLMHEGDPLPLPKDAVVWAGDIHPPQQVGIVHYVGAPHPIKFGDNYEPRLVRIDAKGSLLAEKKLIGIKRWMLDLTDIEQIDEYPIKAKDHVKLRVTVDSDRMAYWPDDKQQLIDWAKDNSVKLMGIEAVVNFVTRNDAEPKSLAYDLSAEEMLTDFAKEEGLPDRTLQWALNLLEGLKNK